MSVVRAFYRSTIGKKIAMAVSGMVLVLFVIGHMVGNLKIFAGVAASTGDYKIDDYGRFLRTMGSDVLGHSGVLWIVRIVLLVCLIAHALSGIQLARLNRRAKPEGYKMVNYSSANAASRTMLFGGLFLLLFILFHILHLTTGAVHTRGFVDGEVYANVFNAFTDLKLVAFYVVAMGLLSAHLYHGTWSMFQTLGVDTPQWNRGIRTGATITAIGLFIGFCSVPIAVAAGLLPPPVASQSAK